MSDPGAGYVAVVIVIAVTVATSLPLGRYMFLVFSGQPTVLDPILVPLERVVIRMSGLMAEVPQDWRAYSRSLLVSNAVMWLATWAVVRYQHDLPLNPDGIVNMEPLLAFHTISSFVTNTNLQHYSGESGLSYLSQMLVVTLLQFVSAATGMAAAVAVARGLAGNRRQVLGNFYVDAGRAAIRVLLPLSFALSLVVLAEGTPMTFAPAVVARTVEGGQQIIARGVTAGVVSIKQLGTNGGGYFGPNAAHPFENPTPLSGIVQAWAMAVIPMAMVWTFGYIVARRRLAVVIFVVMLAIYLPMVCVGVAQEVGGNPAFAVLGIDETGGSMEGKEVRFGAALSAFWAVTTTTTSNGSVNAMHDSLTPLAGLLAMTGMWLNNVFGGAGVGLINMLVFVVVAVFVAGMMIGRTPEFLARKIDAREMKLASLALLWHPLAVLVGTAVATFTWAASPAPMSLGWLRNPGPHGFSEMLYEFSSAAANNGSGFEGLGDNTPFWNIGTGLVMLLSRYIPIIAPLALAASLGAKTAARETAGSLATDSITFGVTLWAVVVILGLLMFAPAAVLGPIAEHLALTQVAPQ